MSYLYGVENFSCYSTGKVSSVPFYFSWQIGSTYLGDNLDLLLRGVLSKLQQAETLSIIQVRYFTSTYYILDKAYAVFDWSVTTA